MSLGKTAAEREAEDTTRESDGGKLAALGLGALFHSNSAAGHAGHAPVGHAHSHGDVPCSHSHGSGHGDTVGGHGHGHGSTPTNLELADRALSSTIFDAAYTGNLIRLRELARLLEVQQLTEHPELLSHAQMQEQMQENASTAMADSAVEATVPAARKFGDEELALVFGSGHVTPRWMIQHDAKGMSVLHHAALGGHLDVLQWLGQQPAVNWEIKTRDAMEAHPVHLTVIRGHFRALCYIITEHPPSTNARDKQGCTPLVVTGQYGELLMAIKLLRAGAPVQATDHAGETCLHWAAYKGHTQLISMLSTVDASDFGQLDAYGQGPAHLAAIRGNTEVMKLLLRLGMDVESPDKEGKSPVQLAIDKQYVQHESIKKVLIQEICNQNQASPEAVRLLQGGEEASRLLRMELEKLSMSALRSRAIKELGDGRYKRLAQSAGRDPDPSRTIGQQKIVAMVHPDYWMAKLFHRYKLSGPYWFGIFCSVLAYFYYVPLMLGNPHDLTAHITFNFLFVAMHVFWYLAATTDAGTFGTQANGVYQADYADAVEEMMSTGIETWTKLAARRLCHTCRIVRPMRSKHTTSFGQDKCIPRFDHDCPWISNSVGHDNHVVFLLFCFWACCSTGSFVVLCARWLMVTKEVTEGTSWANSVVWMHRRSMVGMILLMSFYVVFTAILFSVHISMAARNITTNEEINGRRYPWFYTSTGTFKNPFDRGIKRNCSMFFRLSRNSQQLSLAVNELEPLEKAREKQVEMIM